MTVFSKTKSYPLETKPAHWFVFISVILLWEKKDFLAGRASVALCLASPALWGIALSFPELLLTADVHL